MFISVKETNEHDYNEINVKGDLQFLTLFSYRAHMWPFRKIFDFNSRRNYQKKKKSWASRIRVGRGKEPPENDKKNGLKGVKRKWEFTPFPLSEPTWDLLVIFFYFNSRRDHQKNFLWASRLWVGRRKETILSYFPENDEKKNSEWKGFMHFGHFCPQNRVDNSSYLIFLRGEWSRTRLRTKRERSQCHC